MSPLTPQAPSKLQNLTPMQTDRRYDLVIFDWDGTLRDSIGCIVGCVQAALADVGLEAPDVRIRETVGMSLDASVPRWVPGIDDDLARRVIERYRARWIEEWNDRSDFFPGVSELLQGLREQDYLLTVATGKGRRGLRVDMERSQATHHFVATRTADDCAPKPAPQMVLELLDETGVEADRAVVIGDTVHDLEMARNAGVDAVATLGGAMLEEQLREHSLTVLRQVTDLPGWLAG